MVLLISEKYLNVLATIDLQCFFSAVCFGSIGIQGCNNVGDCVGPNICRCQSGYSGPQCNNSNYPDIYIYTTE